MRVLCKKDFYYPQPEKPIHDLSFLVFKEGEYYNCTEKNADETYDAVQHIIKNIHQKLLKSSYTYTPYTYNISLEFVSWNVHSPPRTYQFFKKLNWLEPAPNNLWYFEDYFYTQKEVRKFKLNKIEK